MQKKLVGDWTLLETEQAFSFTGYAKRCKIDSDYYMNYNHNIFRDLILPWLIQTNNSRRLAIDAGASYGFMSHGFLNHFKKVHAFELVTFVRDCLKENLKSPRIKIYDCGLGSSLGSIETNFYEKRTGHCSVRNNEDLEHESQKLFCPVAPLDLFSFENVDFLKIDVEGYELEVLKGAENTIKDSSPLILLEILKSSKDAIANAMMIHQYLGSLGYNLLAQHNEDFLFGKDV